MPPAPTKPRIAGSPHVDLEAQQRIGEEIGRDLRDDAEPHALRQDAPTEARPSTGFRSAFSLTSENSLPSAPAVWNAIATIAGTGPPPTMKISTSAMTISGRARMTSITRRKQRHERGNGARPRVERSESRTASSAPTSVDAASDVDRLEEREGSATDCGQRRSLGDRLAHQFGREVENLRQAVDEAARVAGCGDAETGCEQRHEERDERRRVRAAVAGRARR